MLHLNREAALIMLIILMPHTWALIYSLNMK